MGWEFEDFIWPNTDTLYMVTEYLTVSSSGPAGEAQSSRMGVYNLTGETHNNKPVWSRYDGTEKIWYSSGNFIFYDVKGFITDT